MDASALDLVPIPKSTLHKRDDPELDDGARLELLNFESFYWGGDGKFPLFLDARNMH